MERKLASIQKIADLQPVPNSDNLEVAQILGWKAVVKKGEFKVGDKIVYIEYDSVVPDRPEFEFLANKHFRVKTVRLRGQVSQGLVMPLTILEQPTGMWNVDGFYEEGMDCTALLGITKYEPPVKGNPNEARGNFPEFIVKTDETRLQTVPNVIARNKHVAFYVTEKYDGQSMTVYYKDGHVGVCSRNMELRDIPESHMWQKAKELHLPESLIDYGRNIAVQGEFVGEGIQKNKYGLKGRFFYAFNVFDIDKFSRVSYADFCMITSMLKLVTVPQLGFLNLTGHTVDSLVEFSKGDSVLATGVPREGIVIRSVSVLRDEELGDLSFKVINPDFLLKYGE